MDKRYVHVSMKDHYSMDVVFLIVLSTCIALMPVSSHWLWIKPDLFLLYVLLQYSKQHLRCTSPFFFMGLGIWLTCLYPYYFGALSILYVVTHMVVCILESRFKNMNYARALLQEFSLIIGFLFGKLCVFNGSLSSDVLYIFQLAVGYHLVIWLMLRVVLANRYANC